MSLLEDRILKIIELREKNYSNSQIAQDLDVPESMVLLYENTTKRAVQDSINSGNNKLEDIARNIGLPLITLDLFMNHYSIKISERGTELPTLSKTRQKTLDKIRRAIENGADNLMEIKAKTGLSRVTIYNYLPYLQELNFKKKSKEERLKEINQGLKEGLKDEEIAERTDLSLDSVRYYKIMAGIKKRKPREERLTQIQQEIENGAKYTDDVAEKLGISPYTIYSNYKDELSKRGINLPSFRKKLLEYLNPKRVPERDRLIAQGLTLDEIAKQDTVTRERIRQYEKGTFQDKIRRQAKEKRQECLSQISAQILFAGRENLTGDEKWAYDMTMRYISKPHAHKNYYSKLLKLLKTKRQAEKEGTKLSLEKYQELTGIGFTYVGRTFSRLGLEPDYGAKKRHITPKWKKQAMERAVLLPLTSGCVAHFLKLPSPVVSSYFSRYSKRKNQRPEIKNSIASFKERKHLTHTLASQIYEATDSEPNGCEFSDNQTIELLNTSQEAIDYSREHRREIEIPILEALRVLYPDENIIKPYLTFRVD